MDLKCCTSNSGYNRDGVTVDSIYGSYSPPEQTLLFLDPLTVGRALNNSPGGTPVPEVDIPANPIFVAFNKAGSGLLEAAALRGEKYTVAQLVIISAPFDDPDDPGNPLNGQYSGGASLMQSLHADYVMTLINDRRARTDTPEYRMRYERFNGFVELLERGRRIFGTVEHEQAGRLNFRRLSAEEIAQQERFITVVRPWFGERSNRIFASQGGQCSNNCTPLEFLEDNP